MQATEKLANFLVTADYGKIPLKAFAVAKMAILDCLGCILAGSQEPTGKIAINFTKGLGGIPQATVLGGGFRTSPPLAALANGVMAHVLDYDDLNYSMGGHPSVTLVPAILALGEARQASGKEVLLAYILGLEVEARIGAAVSPIHADKGWHPTATVGSLGAAAASAKLLGLGVEETRMALGIAASEAGGIAQNFGTMVKPLHAGDAAMNGVIAATLAEQGFTGAKNVLEGEYGFCRLFNGDGNYRLERITDGLGESLDILTTGIALKKYPSCGYSHRAVDGILDLIQQYNITAEEVEKVECSDAYRAGQVLTFTDPNTAMEARFSMQFPLAIALLERAAGMRQFVDQKVTHPKTKEMMKRVQMHVHPDLRGPGSRGREFSIVTVRLKDGREYSKRVDKLKGSPALPLSREELVTKFRECAEPVLSQRAIEQAVELVENLERVENIGDLGEVVISRSVP